MATDRYADANVEAGNRATALAQAGADIKKFCNTTEKTAADNDTSVIRLLKGVPVSAVIGELSISNDALSGATDVDIGFYKTDGGAVLDKDILTDGDDINAGGVVDGLQTVDRANKAKTIAELYLAVAGSAIGVETVDICITGNTIGTASGTITCFGELWVQ